MTILIDNYDSFTYNLVQAIAGLGIEVKVFRNDKIDVDGIAALKPDSLVISPGPGNPDSAGVSLAAVKAFAGKIPILGVCLGHQTIAQAFGGRIVRAKRLMHGKTSRIRHDGKGIFAGLPQYLKDGGVFAVEHGYLQKENIRRLMPEYLTDVISVKDYGDNDRVTCGRFEPKKK